MSHAVRVLNYSGHAITPGVKQNIEALIHHQIDIMDFDQHVPNLDDIEQSAIDLVDAAHLTEADWNEEPPIVLVPGLGVLAVYILTVIHGVSGRFPRIVWMGKNPETGGYDLPHYAELDELRMKMRQRRQTDRQPQPEASHPDLTTLSNSPNA